MRREHRYRLTATWTGDRGAGTADYRAYGRDVRIEVEGKPALEASADVPFHGDHAKWNPEDMLVAALSECHLLSYLYACTKVGVVVVGYHDEAEGTMVEDGATGAFAEVVLHPHVVVASPDMIEAALAAHDDAHAMCYIASSVSFPVRHRPTVTAAD